MTQVADHWARGERPEAVAAFAELAGAHAGAAVRGLVEGLGRRVIPGAASTGLEVSARGTERPAARPLRFSDYQGTVPHFPSAPLIALGSGKVGAPGAEQSFVLLDRNGPTPLNEMFFFEPFELEWEDAFHPVSLPAELAQASHALHVTSLSEHELFFYGVNADDSARMGDDGTALAYSYDHRTGEFHALPTPPVALVNAQVVALDENRVMLTGGHELWRDEDGWSVDFDLVRNDHLPLHETCWIYDRRTQEWSTLPGLAKQDGVGLSPSSRLGVSIHRVGDELWFIGGEEPTRYANGTTGMLASDKVDILDTKTLEWREGPRLPRPIAYTQAMDDGRGGIQLLGGCERVWSAGPEFRWEHEALAFACHLALDEGPSTWTPSPPPETPGAGLAAIPYGRSHLVGPFFDEIDFTPSFKKATPHTAG